ncbi:MAG TPA: hypothetical protein PK367_01910 [Candidatus Paceibacterota bacterium]|nr:hypothetical protein [Candidatus Paceibacterota bacterium]
MSPLERLMVLLVSLATSILAALMSARLNQVIPIICNDPIVDWGFVITILFIVVSIGFLLVWMYQDHFHSQTR